MTVLFSRSGGGRNGGDLKTGDSPKLGPVAQEIAINANQLLEEARLSTPTPEKDEAILKKAQDTLKRCCPTVIEMEKKAAERKGNPDNSKGNDEKSDSPGKKLKK